MKKIEIEIDEELAQKFDAVLLLKKDNKNTLIEGFITNYVDGFMSNRTVSANVKEERPYLYNGRTDEEEVTKVLRKLNKWVRQGIDHASIPADIVAAYLEWKERHGVVYLEDIRLGFTKEYPNMFDSQHKLINNYNSMKTRSEHAHGYFFKEVNAGVRGLEVVFSNEEIARAADSFKNDLLKRIK